MPGNVMGIGGGAGDGQSRVKKRRCLMCRPAHDGLSIKKVNKLKRIN